MASRAQIAANRRNAQLSTGPRTLEGKAQSAANALKHGLRSERATLPSEDRAAHERLRADLFARYAPADEAEARLVDALALAYARLARLPAAEAGAWNSYWQEDVWPKHPVFGQVVEGIDAGAIGMGVAVKAGVVKELALLSLYENRIWRSIERLRGELARLQAERAAAAEEEGPADDPAASAAEPADEPAGESACCNKPLPPIGFVRSREQRRRWRKAHAFLAEVLPHEAQRLAAQLGGP